MRGRAAPLQSLPGAFDILRAGAGKARDNRTPHRRGNRLHRREIAFGRDGESRLDHIDAQPVEVMRHAQLLRHIHAATRRLLAVAQRSVENRDAFHRPGPSLRALSNPT